MNSFVIALFDSNWIPGPNVAGDEDQCTMLGGGVVLATLINIMSLTCHLQNTWRRSHVADIHSDVNHDLTSKSKPLNTDNTKNKIWRFFSLLILSQGYWFTLMEKITQMTFRSLTGIAPSRGTKLASNHNFWPIRRSDIHDWPITQLPLAGSI
jgi:hypothetical protein